MSVRILFNEIMLTVDERRVSHGTTRDRIVNEPEKNLKLMKIRRIALKKTQTSFRTGSGTIATF